MNRTHTESFDPFGGAVRRVRQELHAADPGGTALDHAAICDLFARTLDAQVSALTARTLTPNEPLAPRDRFPVLTRLIDRVCHRSALAAVETVSRFLHDRDEVIHALTDGSAPGRLVGIEPTTGDPHQGGRRVSFLRFADREDPVLYKPRPMSGATLYARLVARLNEDLPGLELAVAPSLVKSEGGYGYGWAGFVRPAPCHSAAEAAVFYVRQGALLALLHAANGVDAHADNIIASRDQPILVDTETLLHPVLARPMFIDADPALAVLEQSVHRTVLLPTLIRGEQSATDVSGLGGRGTPPVRETGGSWSNRPVLDGVCLEPGEHVRDLIRGFTDAYAAIERHRAAYIAVFAGVGDLVVRIVPRATQVYADLLRDSLAPEVLGDERERRAVFGRLAAQPAFEGSQWLAEHEARDLENHDVPIFFARADSRAIRTSLGIEIPDALQASGFAAARAKIRAMNDADRRRQEWLIDAAFATGTGPLTHRCAPRIPPDPAPLDPAPLDPQWVLDQAARIAGRLEALACRGGGRVNWLSLEPLEDSYWAVLPAGAGLPHGYTGVALFLAQLGALTGRTEFLERAAHTIDSLPALLSGLADRPTHLAVVGTGFAGVGGIAYALARLATLLDAPGLRQLAVEAAGLVTRAHEVGQAPDTYADGRAGAITALRSVHRELAARNPAGAGEAAELARALTAEDEFGYPPGPGFLNGGTGIDWALRRRQRPVGAAWIEGAEDGWCSGAAGLAAAGALESPALHDWLDRLAATGPVSDLSLCHGELGILDALAVLATRDAHARTVLESRSAALPRALGRGARLTGTPGNVPTPGLLHGLAGTGYGLLRVGFAHLVPSVLMMQPGTATRTSPNTKTTTTTNTPSATNRDTQ